MVLRPVIVGRFGPPVLACIRSWGKRGFSVGLVWIGSEGECYPKSKYLEGMTLLPLKAVYTDEGIAIIRQFLKRFRADGFLTIDENIACWIYDHKHLFPETAHLWVANRETTLSVLSKQNQTSTVARE